MIYKPFSRNWTLNAVRARYRTRHALGVVRQLGIVLGSKALATRGPADKTYNFAPVHEKSAVKLRDFEIACPQVPTNKSITKFDLWPFKP